MSRKFWSRLIPTRRRVVVYLAVLVGILLLRLAVDLWAGSRLRAVSDRLAPSYGGRLDVASLSPPAVAARENRARIVSAAAALTTVGTTANRREELRLALAGTFSGDQAKRLAILRQVVAENRLAIAVSGEMGTRPDASWEIRYEDGPRMRLPSLPEIRDLSSVNAAAGLVALADGNADEAARRAGLGMTLAGSLGQEPSLLVQLVHMAVASSQATFLRELLAAGEPSDAALQAVAVSLEQERAHDPVVTGLVGELKSINTILGEVENGESMWTAERRPVGVLSRALAWFVRPAIRIGRARVIEDLHLMIQYARLQPFEREQQHLRLPNDQSQPWWWRKAAPVMLGGLSRAIPSGDEHRAVLMLASTAVALRQCRLDWGFYPESVEDLAPIFLPRIPIDPYTGLTPEYTRSAAGFTLRVAAHSTTGRQTKDLLQWTVPR